MDKEMMDECNMCHPQTKAPTFATLQPNFMRNFQSKMPDLVGRPLTLPLSVDSSPPTEGSAHVYFLSSNQIIPEIPEKSRKAQIYLRRLRQMHDLCLANMAFTHRWVNEQKHKGKDGATQITSPSYRFSLVSSTSEETGDQKRIEGVFQLLFKVSEVCFSLLAVNSGPDCWTGRQTHRAGKRSEATAIWLVTPTSHNTTQHHGARWKLTRSCHKLSTFNICFFTLEAAMATGPAE